MALNELLNPFEVHAVPEVIEHYLDYGFTLCCSFDRKGHWLACGLNDGRAVIWDYATKGVVRELPGHTKSVTSVSWSRDSSQLLTGSTDWSAKLWDLSTSEPVVSLTFGGPVMGVQLHPRGQPLAVISVYGERPSLVSLSAQTRCPLPVAKTADEEPGCELSTAVYVAQFDHRGHRVLVGGNKGVLSAVNTARCIALHAAQAAAVPTAGDGDAATPLATDGRGDQAALSRMSQALHGAVDHRVALGNTSVKSIVLSRDGKHFIANCQDRVIRLVDANSLEVLRNFVDTVNRFAWKACCFSANGEYVVAGSAHKANHKIYIWSVSGHLERILDLHKNGVLAVAWHPTRPTLVSCSSNGVVAVWSALLTENWSAFAPNFRELEENDEYIEREDEFDVASEDDDPELRAQRRAEKERAREAEERAAVVDILNDSESSSSSSSISDDNNKQGAKAAPVRRQRKKMFVLPVLLPRAELEDLNQTVTSKKRKI